MGKDPAFGFLNNCCCLLNWCAEKRTKHILRDKDVNFMTEIGFDHSEYDAWR